MDRGDGLHDAFEDTSPGFFTTATRVVTDPGFAARAVWAIRCATRMAQVRPDLDLARAHGVAIALCLDGALRTIAPELVAEAMVSDPRLPG